jgi:CBS domain-containing protein
MRNVQQLLENKPYRLLSISPTASVLDALRQMAEKEIGALVVLDGEKLAGIFSERDYARKIILFGKSSHDTAVSEIMTSSVVCVRLSQSADECMALMTGRRVRHLPVLSEDDKVVGVISIGDVVKEMIDDQRRTIEQLEQYIKS